MKISITTQGTPPDGERPALLLVFLHQALAWRTADLRAATAAEAQEVRTICLSVCPGVETQMPVARAALNMGVEKSLSGP